jgi:hypothetical protein
VVDEKDCVANGSAGGEHYRKLQHDADVAAAWPIITNFLV